MAASFNDNDNNAQNSATTATRKSKPIPIVRPRSGSESTFSDEDSPPIQTPLSPSPPVSFANVSPSSSPAVQPKSPILSYFMPLPAKQSAPVQIPTSPLDSLSKAFGRSVPSSGFNFDQSDPSSAVASDAPEGMSYPNDIEPPLVRHARRLSTTWSQSSGAAVRFSAAVAGAAAVNGASGEDDRGSRLLRRLSLGTALNKNSQTAPPSAMPVDPPALPAPSSMNAKKMRRRTLAVEPPRRAPSPMGERILKGHFDGFA